MYLNNVCVYLRTNGRRNEAWDLSTLKIVEGGGLASLIQAYKEDMLYYSVP